jgi:hypothetical protein
LIKLLFAEGKLINQKHSFRALGNGVEAFFAEMAVERESGFYPQAAHGLKRCAIYQAHAAMVFLKDSLDCCLMLIFVDPFDLD